MFVVPLTAPEATDAGRFGPKASNLARLGQAGLPIPSGFCFDAAAYREQIHALNLEADARGVFTAESSPRARQHALAMKLGLLDKPITPVVLDPPELDTEVRELWRDLGQVAVGTLPDWARAMYGYPAPAPERRKSLLIPPRRDPDRGP